MRLFLLSFALLIALSAQAQEQACKVTTPPVIDAKPEDWTTSWLDDDKEKFKYNICSDDATLYVRIKISDGPTQLKMALHGFTIWLDPKGKKKQKLGLRYPTGIEAQERMEVYKKSGESLSRENNLDRREEKQKALKKGLIDNVEVLELIGIADEPVTSSKSGITNGLLVALGMEDDGAYIYEAAIPFKAFRLVKSQIAVLGVGFETGKITVNQTKGKGNNAAGGMQPSGYSGGGIGSVGGASLRQQQRQSMGGSNYSPMTAPVKMWTTVKLD